MSISDIEVKEVDDFGGTGRLARIEVDGKLDDFYACVYVPIGCMDDLLHSLQERGRAADIDEEEAFACFKEAVGVRAQHAIDALYSDGDALAVDIIADAIDRMEVLHSEPPK